MDSKHRIPRIIIIAFASLALFAVRESVAPFVSYSQQGAPQELLKEMAEKEVPLESPSAPGKLTLQQCIEIAIENNLPLKTADKHIDLAKQKVLEATRRLLPDVSVKYEDLEGTDYSQGKPYKGETIAVEGKQSVFRGGEYMFILKQAKINLKIAEENKRKLKNELIASVKDAFHGLVRAKETINIQQEFLNESEGVNSSVSKQFLEGVCPELEYLDVQARYNQAYYQFISADEDLKLAKIILKQAIDLGPEQQIDIQYSLEYKRQEIDLKQCFSLALKNRPKVKVNELVKEYAALGKKLASSKGWPKIDIMGSYGESGEAFEEDTLERAEEWYLGTKVKVPFGGSTAEYNYTQEKRAPILSAARGTESTIHSYRLNIFDDLKYFSGKKQAIIEFEEAENELKKTKKEVLLEVEENFYNYEKAIIQIDSATSKLKFQSKEVEINKLKRQLGGAADSQVMESLMKLAQEKFSYIQAVTSYFTAIANLNKAIGIADHFKP